MLDDEELLARADRIAAAAHEGQIDKGGSPYIIHLRDIARRVADHGGTAVQQAAALLHDTVIDTSLTVDDLHAQGIPAAVTDIVRALHKQPGESYEQAIERAVADPVVRLVRRADLEANLDPARLDALSGHTRVHLQEKYRRAAQLMDAVEAKAG